MSRPPILVCATLRTEDRAAEEHAARLQRPRATIPVPCADEPTPPPAPEVAAQERRVADEECEQARPIFLRSVGLDAVPEVISYSTDADVAIPLAPAHWHARLVYRWIEGRIGK